ncbi:hypothetical protein ACNJYD_09345 [Bradyrhizobium sp. DASA03005]|uniref:hypothetical protein n=1 Tax=Bradyrhizobium sp. SPXBL-02 TaxID=3395912 RepID=UPI003F6F6F14
MDAASRHAASLVGDVGGDIVKLCRNAWYRPHAQTADLRVAHSRGGAEGPISAAHKPFRLWLSDFTDMRANCFFPASLQCGAAEWEGTFLTAQIRMVSLIRELSIYRSADSEELGASDNPTSPLRDEGDLQRGSQTRESCSISAQYRRHLQQIFPDVADFVKSRTPF